MAHELIMELLFYDVFKPPVPGSENLPEQRKTEYEVIDEIVNFTQDRLRMAYPGLDTVDPDAYNNIASILVDECITEIKTVYRKLDLDGIVSYRSKFEFKDRQTFLTGNMQFLVWEKCAEAVEDIESRGVV